MVTALILSGGIGRRIGTDTPKQYIKVNDKPIILYCLTSLFLHEEIDMVQIVAEEMWHDTITECISKIEELPNGVGCMAKFKGFSNPGKNRQLSIFHGMEDIRKYALDSDYVLIHDAARPLLSKSQITDCLKAAQDHDGAMPVLPMKDTVYISRDGNTVTSLLDRKRVFAGQAPEVFLFGKYYEANQKLGLDGLLRIDGSTEPAVLAGMDIAMIPGDEKNFKITTGGDLDRFREIAALR